MLQLLAWLFVHLLMLDHYDATSPQTCIIVLLYQTTIFMAGWGRGGNAEGRGVGGGGKGGGGTKPGEEKTDTEDEFLRAELLLAEVAIHILVQVEEYVADALSIAPAEPALLGLFWVRLYSELHQLIPHGAHHYVPDAHPTCRRTHTHTHSCLHC